jgi:hypothetical protein
LLQYVERGLGLQHLLAACRLCNRVFNNRAVLGSPFEASAMRLYGSDIVGTLTAELQRAEWSLRVAAAKVRPPTTAQLHFGPLIYWLETRGIGTLRLGTLRLP